MARLGVVISGQTLGYEGGPAPSPPMRDPLNHQLIVSAGRDFLISTYPSTDNPFVPIYFYVTRRAINGQILGPEQRISREDAFRVSTYNYAYTTFEEKLKGSIELGKLADFLILSDDRLTISEENTIGASARDIRRRTQGLSGGGRELLKSVRSIVEEDETVATHMLGGRRLFRITAHCRTLLPKSSVQP